MSNEQTKTETKAITATPRVVPLAPQSLNDVYELAKQLAASEIIPDSYRKNVPNIIAATMMGNDLGISTMQAMREIYVVYGRPASSALLKVALVRQSPLCKYWRLVESTETQATFETLREGDPEPTRLTYTLEDAKKAGLYPPSKGDSNWGKRPKLMLRRRCESELADEVYPDVVKGLRTEDEAAEMVRDMGTVQRVDLSQAQPITATLPAATRIPEVVEPPAEPVKVETQPVSEAKKTLIQDDSVTPDVLLQMKQMFQADEVPTSEQLKYWHANMPRDATREESIKLYGTLQKRAKSAAEVLEPGSKG